MSHILQFWSTSFLQIQYVLVKLQDEHFFFSIYLFNHLFVQQNNNKHILAYTKTLFLKFI